MRNDALTSGATWRCAYEERWVETQAAEAESETAFRDL